MRGGRAILASRGIERPSNEALVGAMMTAEFQAVVIRFLVGVAQASERAAKAKKKSTRAPRRRR